MLIGLARRSIDKPIIEESLEELAELAYSAGAIVDDKVIQTRKPNPAFYVGKGMVERLKETISSNGTNLVIFDDPLSPAQQRNLEDSLGVKVIDRSILILDIFALHARTRAAKLQVELAQLEYMLPRLTGAWSHFSRQHGGIGTKGPGETQLEIDRRRVRTKISRLKKDLKKLNTQNNMTIIMISHYMDEIAYACSKVLVMDTGNDEIKRSSGIRRVYPRHHSWKFNRW